MSLRSLTIAVAIVGYNNLAVIFFPHNNITKVGILHKVNGAKTTTPTATNNQSNRRKANALRTAQKV
jgi:hypothetical protein